MRWRDVASRHGDENDDGAVPTFDEAWIKAAKRSEPEIRRYQIPPPKHVPAPWRTWTPPEQRDPPTARNSPRSLRRRCLSLAGVLAVLAGLIVFGSLTLRDIRARDGATDRTSPAASDPVTPPDVGTPAPVPAPAPITPATRPAAPAARPVPWTPVTAMSLAGPDAKSAEVFGTIKVGACVAETPDLRYITIVPCSDPHTDEVTLMRDLSASFPTTPTNDQIQSLNNQLCPAAAQAWTGGTEERYTPGYLWHFQSGIPGQAVRAFACTVMLTGHSPFSGTLRHAAA